MRPFNEQFTLRGIIIGIVGCVVITASSVYVALKLGALPWPIFFAVLFALFALKLFGLFGKKTNINEANVSATVMTAGAMVAGGLAFTIPGIYMLMPNADVPLWTIILCALCGVTLGWIGTALFRKYFIEDSKLPYVVGTGAAETLEAGDSGGHKATLLFGGLGFSAFFAVVRDWFGAIPQTIFGGLKLPGIAQGGISFGVWCSPMALALGFMIPPLAALVWFIGALIGDFGVVAGGSATGLWDVVTGQGIKMSLGIGVMIGCGIGIVIKIVLPKIVPLAKSLLAGKGSASNTGGVTNKDASKASKNDSKAPEGTGSMVRMRWAPFVVAALALVMAFVLNWGLLAALIVVVLVWVVMTMSAQSTGQAGLNPMEVFGLIVLLVVALVTQIGGVEAFLVAATVTVCCGFVGDLMNDFKAGQILKTNPRAQWIGEGIGGIIGAVVAAGVVVLLVSAYGPESFGPGNEFVAPQAAAVSALVGGIPNLPAFVVGLLVGVGLYLLGAPVITLGLGIYLPFHLSLTIALGALIRFIVKLIAPAWSKSENPLVLASGLLAGESIAGIIIALITVVGGLVAVAGI
ncbi:MAG: OPT/YSL family transporter [Coriobacteriia bacterium]|nr:OPT/YSL family transporter [Coriobacteriia bacterium]